MAAYSCLYGYQSCKPSYKQAWWCFVELRDTTLLCTVYYVQSYRHSYCAHFPRGKWLYSCLYGYQSCKPSYKQAWWCFVELRDTTDCSALRALAILQAFVLCAFSWRKMAAYSCLYESQGLTPSYNKLKSG